MLGFRYDSFHSSQFHIKAIKTSRPLVPEKRHEFVEIPFKSGSVLLPDNSSPDITIPIQCQLELPKNISIHDVGRSIRTWLNKSDWKPLIFDDDPGYYYQSICTSAITVEDLKSGTFTIEFRCNPDQVAVR